jgi:hypothetical protein
MACGNECSKESWRWAKSVLCGHLRSHVVVARMWTIAWLQFPCGDTSKAMGEASHGGDVGTVPSFHSARLVMLASTQAMLISVRERGGVIGLCATAL